MLVYNIGEEKVLKQTSFLPSPSSPKCLEFSRDGKYLCIESFAQGSRKLFLYSSSSLALLNETSLNPTLDISGISFSPNSEFVAVWESPLTFCVSIFRITGKCVRKYSGYRGALGVRTVEWSADSSRLSIGCYDGVVRILRRENGWQPISSNKENDVPLHHSNISFDTYDKKEPITFSEVKNHCKCFHFF